MRHLRRSLVLAVVSLVGSLPALAQTVITLTKGGSDVVINISGVPMFSVYRASQPDFSFDGATLADGLAASTYTDVGALQASTVLYCYDIAAVGESSSGRGAGGSPQPSLQLTLLTPNAGKEGDSITISGTGFGQFYPENLVTFSGKPAVVTAVGPGTIAVTVPTGATTGAVQVRVGRLASNTLPFTLSPVGAFSNLSGIATNPANFKVFVTDTGASSGTSLIELDPFSGWTKTTRGGVGNIRGFPYSPLNNRLYYCNGSRSTANAGTITYWDLGASTQASFPTNAGDLFADPPDPVSCAAMGASPVNPTFVFYADRRNQQVRRVGDFTGRTVYASGFSFPDSDYNPANVSGFSGLAFDSNGTNGTTNFGDLFVGNGTNVDRVFQTDPINTPDATTRASVLTGLVSVAGVAFDAIGTTEYRTRTLHVADRAGNALWLHNAVSGTAEQRLTGLNQPRMATLGQTNDTPPETRLYIAEPTRVVATDDLRVEMTPRENIRAIISNCPSGNSTPGCVGAPYPSAFQTLPRQIAIMAQVHPARSGVTIHFDVEDPPDTSPYAGVAPPGDNVGGAGLLAVPSAVTNAIGQATTVLTVTDRYAGDNYRVRARLAAGGPVVAKTGVITAWKRVFVEMDRMFRGPGQYLTTNSTAGATTLAVTSTSRFTAGDTVDVFDAVNDIPEVRQVQSVGPTTITLTSPLSKPHLTGDSAYVGREADGFYAADMSFAYATFDDGFVEVVARPHGAHPIPYTPEGELDSLANRSAFSATWFKNGKMARDGTNYLHVIGCETFLFGVPLSNGYFGLSFAPNNWLFVAVKAIEGFYGADQTAIRNAIRNTGQHEVGHHLAQVDETAMNPAWCNPPGLCPGELCIMDAATSTSAGIDEFETADLLTNATSIRKLVDPI